MKSHLETYRDPTLTKELLHEIRQVVSRIPLDAIRLMEVCGTHTMAIARYGIRSLLPDRLQLVSGPGCPVCVTPAGYIDAAISLAHAPDTTVVTFGDMMRVPGSNSFLAAEKAAGADIRVAYSPAYALDIAQTDPARKVVFLAIGFETTSPSIAWTILQARRKNLDNISFLPANKLIPPALEALAASDDLKIHGFICPGHVSTIIGSVPYQPIAKNYRIPCVIGGFEPIDVLLSVLLLCRQIERGEPTVEIEYSRTVPPEGNRKALDILDEVFEPADSPWRGLGTIPASGLEIREHLSYLDAAKAFDLHVSAGSDDPACRCGDVLRGLILPPKCPLFRTRCTPASPVGPCMVSSEGACAAFHKYNQSLKKEVAPHNDT